MSEMEKSKLIQLLMEQRDEQRRREEAASKEREALQARITELIEASSRQTVAITGLMKRICDLTSTIKQKDRKIADLESRLSLAQRTKYSRTSPKKS